MERRAPSQPRVAWEEDGGPQESSSPVEPYEVTMVQPLQTDAAGLAVCEEEQEAMAFIQTFVRLSCPMQDDKLQFLESIRSLCRSATNRGSLAGLECFCRRHELAEKVEALLSEEPQKQMRTELQLLAMLAITQLSSVLPELLDNTQLISSCFRSVLLLPPEEEVTGLEASLYTQTVDAMDIMLKAVVLRSGEVLQDVLEVLLTFTSSERAVVRERALQRICSLSHWLASCSTLEAGQDEDRDDACGKIQIPVLGKLFGRLILMAFEEEKTNHVALDALYALLNFICQQQRVTLPEDNAQLQAHWEDGISSSLHSPNAKDFIEAVGKYLGPSERTHIILSTITMFRYSSPCNHQVALSMLEVIGRDPDWWLMDVPKIVSHIYHTGLVTDIQVQHTLHCLLLLVADRSPGQVVTTLLQIAPRGDRNALSLWEVMFSVPQTVEKVLKELRVQLQDLKNGIFRTFPENDCLSYLALLASEDVQEEEFAPLYKTCRFLLYSANSTDREITSLLLRALITLSNRDDRARKMKVLLPDLMNLLRQNCTSLVMMALMVLQNMMKCLKRTEASSIAADVARILWYHFDEEESWVRESCISSFRDLVRTVVGKEKKWMKNFVHTVLAPLILRMNDEAPKVGQASRNALLAIAELLKWKEMKHVVKTRQTWKMAECLMKKDSSRAEQYLLQSLKYLKDPQECVRDSTIRFIGTIMRHVKDQSTEVPALIVRELQALEKGGCEFICCLAAQTSLILSRLREQQSPAGSRCSLWCWHR
ncbi:uncharacterized protein LOC135287342 isoform X2 [Passer domesticus]|uniref:uncharacterized protein LOC135287342 isoform X2 n=1 Tax=Passer domesticus TaxID=48849 RepID=UPI0030FE9C97